MKQVLLFLQHQLKDGLHFLVTDVYSHTATAHQRQLFTTELTMEFQQETKYAHAAKEKSLWQKTEFPQAGVFVSNIFLDFIQSIIT